MRRSAKETRFCEPANYTGAPLRFKWFACRCAWLPLCIRYVFVRVAQINMVYCVLICPRVCPASFVCSVMYIQCILSKQTLMSGHGYQETHSSLHPPLAASCSKWFQAIVLLWEACKPCTPWVYPFGPSKPDKQMLSCWHVDPTEAITEDPKCPLLYQIFIV